MIKLKNFLAILCLLLLALPVVIADEETDATFRFEIAQARVELQTVTLGEVAMPAAIEYLGDLGVDTSELEELKTEFLALAENVQTFTSKAGLREGNQQMRTIVKSFKESSKLLAEEVSSIEELKTAVTDAITNDSDGLILEAKNNLSVALHDFTLDKHGRLASKMAKLLDLIHEKMPLEETSELQAIYDEFIAYDLTGVVNDGTETEIKDALTHLRGLNKEFMAGVKDVLGNRGAKQHNKFRLVKASHTLNKMDATINDLEDLEYDVTQLQEWITSAQNAFDKAQLALESNDKEALKTAAKDFKSSSTEFKKALVELVGPDHPTVEEIESADDEVEVEDSDESDSDESDRDESDTDEVDSDESDSDEVDSDESDSDESDRDESDTDEVDSDESDSDEVDTDEVDSDEVDSDESDSDEVDESEEVTT
jgi:cobalamin biosynthesis protein CobT